MKPKQVTFKTDKKWGVKKVPPFKVLRMDMPVLSLDPQTKLEAKIISLEQENELLQDLVDLLVISNSQWFFFFQLCLFRCDLFDWLQYATKCRPNVTRSTKQARSC